MKLKIVVLFIFIANLIFGLSSCCREKNDNTERITSDFSINQFNEYELYDCFHFPDTMCIRHDSTYRRVFSNINSPSGCADVVLPGIDFSKKSILIYRKAESGVKYFHRDIIVDDANKTVQYIISTTSCFCPDKCESLSYNMIIVSKIPDDYTIIYE